VPCWKAGKEIRLCGVEFLCCGQHGSVTTSCTQAFIIYALQKSPFSSSSGQGIYDWCFTLIYYTFKQTQTS